jgi:hypothetical protein
MITPLFCIGAAGLIGLSAICIKATAPFSEIGCEAYAKRQAWRALGFILLFSGALCTLIALLSQFSSSF